MTRHIRIQDRSQTYRVFAYLKDKKVSYTVTAFSAREALEKAMTPENLSDARDKMGDGEIVWNVEEDFL